MEWPGRARGSCPPAPPFAATVYLETLTGAARRNRVSATVGTRGGILARTGYGDPLTALEAGRYTIAVSDRSRSDNFHLVGPALNLRTGLRFRGRATWRVELQAGAYGFRSDRAHSRSRGSFAVLAPG
jgi:hypothetical protein